MKTLKEEIESCRNRAKYLGSKRKSEAILLLRKGNRLKQILEKREKSIETIEEILERIEESHTDKEILEAYRLGTSSIKEATVKQGLTLESIDNTMEDLTEVLADQKEIDNALVAGIEELQSDPELEEQLSRLMTSNEGANSTSPLKPISPQEELDLSKLTNAMSLESSSSPVEPQTTPAESKIHSYETNVLIPTSNTSLKQRTQLLAE